ncbi:expressed unknown protein [Seminavis robusta]|uniref:Uncharacterized protein n=1 Tax=Seminavis robusta TaxID=568900 RepID=A0A9N8EGC4_9STRA|nr:expressed unknown protein [Seminavis robusta]|eukprot:Sro904_g218380.1 n/a (204) ;mRNA; f:20912-21523
MTTKRAMEDSPCSSSTSNKRRRKMMSKRVHFAVFDDDDSIPPHETIHIVPRVSEMDAPSVWYSTEEFHHTRRCDAHWIRFYNNSTSSQEEDYKQHLFRVLGTACGKMEQDTHSITELADSPLRGLEREMTPCFRLRKKHIVQNVLTSQKALVAWNKQQQSTTTCSSDKGAEILASHYRKLALPASRFARLLAQGDAQVVASTM